MNHPKTLCDKSNPEDYVIKDPFKICKNKCLEANWCLGYERMWAPEDKCTLFKVLPKLGGPQNHVTCFQAGWL